MANYCEGLLKLRGRQEDVFTFLTNEVHVYDVNDIVIDSAININKTSSKIILSKAAHIEGTERNLLEPATICVDKDVNGNACIALNFKAVWKVYSEPYIEFSKKYHIDIKIDAFEKNTEFSRHILIENGELKKDIEKHYDNYIWDCIMPKLGG